MAMHGSDLRLFAHRIVYERVESGDRSGPRWHTAGRCRCPGAPWFYSELAPHAGGLRTVNRQHQAHVEAVEGGRPPKLTRAQEELLLSWDEEARQLRPPGPPAGGRWYGSATRLVQLGLLRSQSGWRGAPRSYRASALEPTANGYRMIRLLALRDEADPLRRRASGDR